MYKHNKKICESTEEDTHTYYFRNIKYNFNVVCVLKESE